MRTLAKKLFVAGGAALALCLGTTYWTFAHASPPPVPSRDGTLRESVVDVGGMKRTFVSYVPSSLGASPALILAFHGGGGGAEQLRVETAYELETLADAHDLVVVYPDGFESHWNTCQKSRTEAATAKNVDDVAFARALIARFRSAYGVKDVFAFGYSNGGHMAMRLAIEAPSEITAATAIAANMPAEADDKCVSARGVAASPLLLVNGTADPVNPYDGGELSFHGLLDMGPVRSTAATGDYFRAHGSSDVRLLPVLGGGHSIPQSQYRFPKMFGATSSTLDAPREALRFFEQHATQTNRSKTQRM